VRRLGAVEIQDRGDATEVRLAASGPLAYFAYSLDGIPGALPRVVIDLAGARVEGGPREVLGGRGVIERAMLIDGGPPDYVSRLELVLRAPAEADVRDTGSGLVILVAKTAPPATGGGGPAADARGRHGNGAPPVPPATVLASVAIDPAPGALRVVLSADGVLAANAFRLDARRIVLDLEGVANRVARAVIPVEHELLERVRIGQHATKVRVVLDLRRAAAYTVEPSGSDLVIRLTAAN
jgi:hypothetical protein